jgi:hypothetical protein
MLRHLIAPALLSAALVPAATFSQTTATDEALRNLPQKIHDELAAKGFKDVKIVPGSYIVSGKDKDGNPVMMVIGPNSMTMMTGAPDDGSGAPSIAESPDRKELFRE